MCIDSKKVIMMTKLAMYDKEFAKKDKRINSYFKHDYTYVQNAWTRFFVLIGCAMVMGVWLLDKIINNEVGDIVVNYKYYGICGGVFITSMLVVYTVISHVLAVRRYERAKRRLDAYNRALMKINTMDYNKNTK